MPRMADDAVTMDKIVALCKRRGLHLPRLGDLRRDRQHLRLRPLRRAAQAQRHRRVVAGDDRRPRRHRRARLGDHPAPATWEASGHLAGFTDPLVDCKTCGQRFRADHLARARRAGASRPSTRARTPECDLTEAREFNLMFETTIGPVKEAGVDRLPAPRDRAGHLPRLQDRAAASRARSRRSASPRSASRSATRSRPGNFIFRTLEFEQMEMEFFVPPDEAQQWHEHWLEERLDWYVRLGIRARPPPPAPARRRRAQPLLERHQRRRVPLPDRLVRARGHRQPRRLRPHPARPALRREARVLRHRSRASATSRT